MDSSNLWMEEINLKTVDSNHKDRQWVCECFIQCYQALDCKGKGLDAKATVFKAKAMVCEWMKFIDHGNVM